MRSDHRISYWRKGQHPQNFGDMLSELLFSALCRGSWMDPKAGRARSDYDVIHLLGSVISDWHIERDLEHVGLPCKRPIAFWGCGKRDEKRLRPDLAERCSFLGARGPLTRDLLGLPPDTPLGDPGLLLPLIHKPQRNEQAFGRSICIPHFLDKQPDRELTNRTGAELIVRPNIAGNLNDLVSVVDAIAGAKFVLAGSLHAAIVACAYDVPFAYFNSGYIDVPFKWKDFAASIEIPCHFATSIDEGRLIYEQEIRHSRRRPDMVALLACCPLTPPRRLVRRASRSELPCAS